MTHRALLIEVWGPEYEDDTHVLRAHIANLRRKIEPGDGPAVHPHRPGVGYRFDGLTGVCTGSVRAGPETGHGPDEGGRTLQAWISCPIALALVFFVAIWAADRPPRPRMTVAAVDAHRRGRSSPSTSSYALLRPERF